MFPKYEMDLKSASWNNQLSSVRILSGAVRLFHRKLFSFSERNQLFSHLRCSMSRGNLEEGKHPWRWVQGPASLEYRLTLGPRKIAWCSRTFECRQVRYDVPWMVHSRARSIATEDPTKDGWKHYKWRRDSSWGFPFYILTVVVHFNACFNIEVL